MYNSQDQRIHHRKRREVGLGDRKKLMTDFAEALPVFLAWGLDLADLEASSLTLQVDRLEGLSDECGFVASSCPWSGGAWHHRSRTCHSNFGRKTESPGDQKQRIHSQLCRRSQQGQLEHTERQSERERQTERGRDGHTGRQRDRMMLVCI